MKRQKNILIAIIAITLLGSCRGDLLDLTPYDSVASGNMWTTENLADQGVNGVYSVLRLGDSDGIQNYVGLGLIQFESYGVTADNRDQEAMMKGSLTSSSGLFSEYWKQHYEGIHRANDAIANLPKAPMDEGKTARLIAECKFLRAYFYYKLNMVYKGVPLYLEPIELEECIRGRETEAKIWEVVIQDLTDCINEPNLPGRVGKSDWGRVTKSAAYALRGKAYLWTKEWAKAEADFKEVGKLGHVLFTDGADAYKKLFKAANEACDEMIFSVQCIGIEKYGQSLSFRYGTRSSYGGGWNTFTPNPNFVDSYEWADGKPFSWDDVIPGYTAMDPKTRAVYFMRDGMTETQQNEIVEKQGIDITKYDPDGNVARIRGAYDGRDPRLELSIITPYAEYTGVTADNANDLTYVLRYPFYSDYITDKSGSDLKVASNNFWYLFRKFVAEGAKEVPNRNYSPIDFPLIRYADVLLNLAEALNEQNDAEKMEEAISCVNLVRARAGVALLNADGNAYTQVAGQADLRERIRNERRWELCGEGINYFDELRWGTWEEKKFYPGSGQQYIWGQNVYTNSYGGDHYKVWAIPSAERAQNRNLEQNPSWVD